MEGLPFLPGNSFSDPTKMRYHRSQTLDYKNGYSLPRRPEVGIGGIPIHYNQLSEQELDELANFKPTLTYGQAKQAPPEDFVPAHVAWDKKVLKFDGYFKQTVHESPKEHFRVRPVDIFYYLEDDSISVVEPHVENSGMPQGKLIKRQRLPKDDEGNHWHWKDINLGINVVFYGKVFQVVNCDQWTKDFLESEGIEVNSPTSIPQDPYIGKRTKEAELKTFQTPSSFDKLKQFMEMDRKVLRLFCQWDDRDNMFGEMRPFVLHYYLVDDTLEVREMHAANDGHDPFPVLIGRHKVPKDRRDVSSTFPAVVMELSEQEIKDYFTPKDFKLGETFTMYGRRFIVTGCDDFTKAFYYHHFGVTDFAEVDTQEERKGVPKMEIPPYNGYGSLEDSLQSCLSLIPQPPKKDFIKMLENDHKVLRFEAVMDSVRPEDSNRRFVICYRLSDDMITIYEPPVRNSGIIGGKFLERTRVAKPGCPPDVPQFYGPQDFKKGGVIEIFSHRFVITDCDDFVKSYMYLHNNQFPAETMETWGPPPSMGSSQEPLAPTKKGGPMVINRTNDPDERGRLVREVKGQLKKIAITDKSNIRAMFLKYDKDRSGYLNKWKVKEMCKSLHLPQDDDILDEVIREMKNAPLASGDSVITLEEFRQFMEK